MITFVAMETEKPKYRKFVLRISNELKEKAEVKAKEDNRSLNSYILSLISADQKGFIVKGSDLINVIKRSVNPRS